MSEDFFVCPSCGEEVRVGSVRCFGCEPRRPWEQDEAYDGTGVGEDDWDYDEFVRQEFGEGSGGKEPSGKRLFWCGVAIGLVVVFLWGSLSGVLW